MHIHLCMSLMGFGCGPIRLAPGAAGGGNVAWGAGCACPGPASPIAIPDPRPCSCCFRGLRGFYYHAAKRFLSIALLFSDACTCAIYAHMRMRGTRRKRAECRATARKPAAGFRCTCGPRIADYGTRGMYTNSTPRPIARGTRNGIRMRCRHMRIYLHIKVLGGGGAQEAPEAGIVFL